MNKELIVYGRTYPCGDQTRAQRFLRANNVSYRQINIDQDEEAARFVEEWVGHRSVPTIVVAQSGDRLPIAQPEPLPAGRSARSYDRGTMITEPSEEALQKFLARNGIMG